VKTAQYLRQHFPKVKVLARSRSRTEAVELRKLGVAEVRETFGSALQTARQALEMLGEGAYAARKAAFQFRDHDEKMMQEQIGIGDDEEKLIAFSKRGRQDFANLVAREQDQNGSRGWHSVAEVTEAPSNVRP
jgi:voltage-gated potassium channel Kch